jgi:hypothetical protein
MAIPGRTESRWTALRGAAVIVPLILLGACAHLTAIGTVANLLEGVLRTTPGEPATGEIVARIDGVDPQRQHVVVEMETGEWGAIAYSGQSRAFDSQGREIRVGALPVGEWARLRLREAQQGYHLEEVRILHEAAPDAAVEVAADTVPTDTIPRDTVPRDTIPPDTVPTPRPDSPPAEGELAGAVVTVDLEEGRFTVRSDDGAEVRVTLPYNPSPQTRERFELLRAGDEVRLEGEWLGESRFELRRFLGPLEDPT